MANAGGAWDNAKKIVEVELHEKGTPLHAATVVGDTVGDPFKDTSSVALNPIIKFTTLFGLLAVELAIQIPDERVWVGAVLFAISVVFVWRSFYCMRIQCRTDNTYLPDIGAQPAARSSPYGTPSTASYTVTAPVQLVSKSVSEKYV